MKNNLIAKMTRKQLERICFIHKMITKGSRLELENSVKALSYSVLVADYNYLING